ncbi:MAG: lipocalin family protein [Chitinophagaceae bacterium]|nr:lipocalin family protein [Chitinophagaceae bacterium]MBP9102274.1 lipocalin family protein [Chitinophagaceae bacterium]
MKHFLYLVVLLAACHPKEKEPSIVGKWEYVRMETYNPSEPINLQDSMLNALHESQKGMTFWFGNKIFKATSKRPDGSTEPMGEQHYELAEDRKTVVLNNTGRADDKFPIIELSDSLLKINIFYSPKAYMVFKRMD